MNSVHLVGANGKIYSKESVLLKTSTISYHSSKKRVFKGKYYYEFTHKSGDNYHLVGFSTNEGSYIAFFASKLKGVVYYSRSITSSSHAPYASLELGSISNDHTIGVGIDVDNNCFIVKHKSVEKKVIMNKNDLIKSWDIFLVEGTEKTFTDIISINFGEKKFQNNPPLGFHPWCRLKTIVLNQINSKYFVIIYSLLIFVSC